MYKQHPPAEWIEEKEKISSGKQDPIWGAGQSFKHKGLLSFVETGSKKGIIPEHALKKARILDSLDASIMASDMDLPGYYLHKLSGQDKGTWSVRVNGNWRITFLFEGEDAIHVDYKKTDSSR